MSSHRDRLVAFYEKYAPRKVGQVDAQLEKYAGREEDFFVALVQKYGPEPGTFAGSPARTPAGSLAVSEPATPTTTGRVSSHRDRLVAFYEKYAPRKVGQVDAQLEKYAGREEDFFVALVQKYGPEPGTFAGSPARTPAGSLAVSEPATPTTTGRVSSHRDRLVAFYEKYAPRKVGQVDAQLEKYAGREEDFFVALVQKYGPEPGTFAGSPARTSAGSLAVSEPATPTTTGRVSSHRDRLVAFYEKYAPRKVGQVDAQLEKYAGREEDFFVALVQKYGPEPGTFAGSPARTPAGGPADSPTATGAAEVTALADHHQSTAAKAAVVQEAAQNAVVRGEGAIARHIILDEGQQERLQALAAKLGVVVKSDDPLLVLGALLDATEGHGFRKASVPDADAQVSRVPNESMYAPSTSRFTAAARAALMDSHSLTDVSEMLAAMKEEEAFSRAALELLAADDFDILQAAQRRELRCVELNGVVSALRASVEAALLRRAWREWHDTAAEYVKRAAYGQRHHWTPYQKMLFSKSVAMYYDRLARSQRQQERRRRQVDTEAAEADATRRRRLRQSVAVHGNIVNRNILAVLLKRSPGSHSAGGTPGTPQPSPDAVLAGDKADGRGRSPSRRLARSPCWHSDTANSRGLSFNSYGGRNARLLAIERDFDRLPSDARARVVRRLQKWDILPASPTRHASTGSTHPHGPRERSEERLARRLDTLSAFAAVTDEDAPPQWWKSEAELRQYLTHVLVEAFDAEERGTPVPPYEAF